MTGVSDIIQLLNDLGILGYILTAFTITLASLLWGRFVLSEGSSSGVYTDGMTEKEYQRMISSIENYDFKKIEYAPFPMEDDEDLFD